ncbi:YitT family protein [Paenibacillus turpanensis]|uniref:YitT family protein n=1 Tax=Paenibacillus turpanensis TaxID=2689078 RepID=UPI001FB59BDE|nr:YitT family protein [Paenibacillus turpanensis]
MLGTAIYAFGIHYFILPNALTEGGVTGITILLNYAFSIPLSISTLVLNVPLFIWGWRVLGGKNMIYTIVGTVSLAFFLWIMELLTASGWMVPFQSEQDLFLATLYAGVTIGIGIGVVLRFGGTTGGVDIIARILHKKKGWSFGQIILMFDILVLAASLLYISQERVLYTLVAAFIASKLIDIVQDGVYAARAFTVISEHAEKLSHEIMQELDRGVTLFPAKGAFSGNEKNVVYCVVQRQETRRLQGLIRRVDPKAFIIISEVHDVLGEGFRPDT